MPGKTPMPLGRLNWMTRGLCQCDFSFLFLFASVESFGYQLGLMDWVSPLCTGWTADGLRKNDTV